MDQTSRGGDQPLCSGYLEKKGTNLGWDRHFFVLYGASARHESTLQFYDDHTSTASARGFISIPEGRAQVFKSGLNVLELQLQNRSHVLKCVDTVDRDTWAECLWRACAGPLGRAEELEVRETRPIWEIHANVSPPTKPAAVPSLALNLIGSTSGDASRKPLAITQKVATGDHVGTVNQLASRGSHATGRDGDPAQRSAHRAPPQRHSSNRALQEQGASPAPSPRGPSSNPRPYIPPRVKTLLTPRGASMQPHSTPLASSEALQSTHIQAPGSQGGSQTARASSRYSPLQGSPKREGSMTSRMAAPPVPVLISELIGDDEPEEAQEIFTQSGTTYFRAATRISPRNYKSFLARKFLQPDVEEQREASVEDVSARILNASTKSPNTANVVTDTELIEFVTPTKKQSPEPPQQTVHHDSSQMTPRTRSRTERRSVQTKTGKLSLEGGKESWQKGLGLKPVVMPISSGDRTVVSGKDIRSKQLGSEGRAVGNSKVDHHSHGSGARGGWFDDVWASLTRGPAAGPVRYPSQAKEEVRYMF